MKGKLLFLSKDLLMAKRTITENELIKNHCKIECKWDNGTAKWMVKITHITDGIAFSGVSVSMEGFENFREATDEAVKLFKRNIRNDIKELQPIRVKYKAEDIWPEYLEIA